LQEIEDDAEDEQDDDPAATPLGQELYELARGIAQADPSIPPEELFRVKCSTDKGALPNLDQSIWLDLTEVDDEAIEARYRSDGARLMEFPGDSSARAATEIRQERLRRTGMTRFIDELVLGPLRIVRDHLQDMTYIGPLREIPRRGFRPRLSPDESRWAHGLAAWDLLYADTSGKLLAHVNDWMSGEGKLGTDYALEKFAFKEVPVPSRFHQIFERGLNEEDLGELQELYASLAARTEIALRDLERGIVVAPSDVGVGISQMVPVIVASLRDSDGILAVEQPGPRRHEDARAERRDPRSAGMRRPQRRDQILRHRRLGPAPPRHHDQVRRGEPAELGAMVLDPAGPKNRLGMPGTFEHYAAIGAFHARAPLSASSA
jgi:hypothetical protein